jgi:hypothetical protein
MIWTTSAEVPSPKMAIWNTTLRSAPMYKVPWRHYTLINSRIKWLILVDRKNKTVPRRTAASSVTRCKKFSTIPLSLELFTAMNYLLRGDALELHPHATWHTTSQSLDLKILRVQALHTISQTVLLILVSHTEPLPWGKLQNTSLSWIIFNNKSLIFLHLKTTIKGRIQLDT